MIIFWSLGAFDPGSSESGAALFFGCLLAYMTPCFHYIIGTSVAAIDDLEPFMGLTKHEQALLRDSISRKPNRSMLIMLLAGAAAGLIHEYFILSAQGDVLAILNELSILDGVVILATFLTWCLLTTIMVVLTDNALIFARLGKSQIKVDLLNPKSLTPLARVSVISTLSIIGAVAIFPLMFLEDEVSLLAMGPGMTGLLVPMLWLFFLPVWPVHKRIKAARHNELHAIQRQLEQMRQGNEIDSQMMSKLQPLLIYRNEIQQVPEWPFDSVAIARLMLYLIIPPLTWVGAALIEILVDSLV
jgi:hypothetical protein